MSWNTSRVQPGVNVSPAQSPPSPPSPLPPPIQQDGALPVFRPPVPPPPLPGIAPGGGGGSRGGGGGTSPGASPLPGRQGSIQGCSTSPNPCNCEESTPLGGGTQEC